MVVIWQAPEAEVCSGQQQASVGAFLSGPGFGAKPSGA